MNNASLFNYFVNSQSYYPENSYKVKITEIKKKTNRNNIITTHNK